MTRRIKVCAELESGQRSVQFTLRFQLTCRDEMENEME